jgi:hypothetical protein
MFRWLISAIFPSTSRELVAGLAGLFPQNVDFLLTKILAARHGIALPRNAASR